MLNHVDFLSVRAWGAKAPVAHTRAVSFPRNYLGPEFHSEVAFWSVLVAGGLGSSASLRRCAFVSRSLPRLLCGRTPQAMPSEVVSWGLSLGWPCGGAFILAMTCARLRATIRG